MKYVITLGLCAISSASLAATQDAQSTIAVKQGQTQVEVPLKANPTTGYNWFLEKCSHGIKPVSASYVANKSKLVGAPGMMTWTFKLGKSSLKVPRLLKCDLVYMRPWDHSTATKKTLWFVTGS